MKILLAAAILCIAAIPSYAQDALKSAAAPEGMAPIIVALRNQIQRLSDAGANEEALNIDLRAQMTKLQSQIDALTKERDALKAAAPAK